jgi:prolyl oligopeptidase
MSVATSVPEGKVRSFHGITVHDPFWWLEQRDSEETETWVRNQQAQYEQYFSGSSALPYLREQVRKHLDVETFDQPLRAGEKLFYRRRQPGQEQPSICVRSVSDSAEHVIFSSSGNPFRNISIHSVSADGTLLACSVGESGADKKAMWFFNTESLRQLRDVLPTGRNTGLAFRTESNGFFYSHETAGQSGPHQIRFHSLGEPASTDRCVFSAPRTKRSRLLLLGDRGRLGVVYWRDTQRGLSFDLYLGLQNENPEWLPVLKDVPAPDFPLVRSGRLLLYSERESPLGSLYELEWDGSIRRQLVSNSEAKIRQIAVTQNNVYTAYDRNNGSHVRQWSLEEASADDNGRIIDLPRGGTIRLLPIQSADRQELVPYSFESCTEKLKYYEFSCGVSRPIFTYEPPPSPDPVYVSTESFAVRDEVALPFTMLGYSPNRSVEPAPTILTAYGGFGSVSTPTFSVLASIFVSLGATYVVAHVRGGGEFGPDWHRAGRGRNRSTGTQDLIAISEWLLEHHASSIGLLGGSHGGLLVALATLSAPHLFSATVCIGPLLDMVRYESFDRATQWISEYGTVEDALDFESLLANSPYHQVAEGVAYPPFLFVTGDSDDRCNSAHVRKMVARLQARTTSSGCVLVDYTEERGHQPVLPLSVRIEALARRILFLCCELRIPVPRSSSC